MDKDGDKNVERPKRPVLLPKRRANNHSVTLPGTNNYLLPTPRDTNHSVTLPGTNNYLLPTLSDNNHSVTLPGTNNYVSNGNSNDYENRDWWLQDLGAGTAEGDQGNERNMEESSPARSNNHYVTGRKRGAHVLDSDSMSCILDDQGSDRSSHCGGKKKAKRSMKSCSRKKRSGKKAGGKKDSGKKEALKVAKKKETKEDLEEQKGFNFFMKMLREELIAKRVALADHQVEEIGRDIWRKMTSVEKNTFILAAALYEKKESKGCTKGKKPQSEEGSKSKDGRNKKKEGRGKSQMKNKD